MKKKELIQKLRLMYNGGQPSSRILAKGLNFPLTEEQMLGTKLLADKLEPLTDEETLKDWKSLKAELEVYFNPSVLPRPPKAPETIPDPEEEEPTEEELEEEQAPIEEDVHAEVEELEEVIETID